MKTQLLSSLLILFVCLMQASVASAACRSVFTFDLHGSIMIQDPAGGTPDGDADGLWKAMNVPEQDSLIGPGKSIVSDGREINFVCANRRGQYTCTLTFNSRGPRSPQWLKMDPAAKTLHFLVTGAEATFFTQKIHRPPDGRFDYLSSDRKFRLVAAPEHFEIQYSEAGLR